jgi:hypothetical protein
MPTPSSRMATTASATRRDDADGPARLGIFDGVVEKIGEDLREAHRIGVDVERFGRRRHRQGMAAAFERGLRGFDGVGDGVAQIDARPAQLDLPARDARHLKQIVDQPDEMLRLTVDHAEELATAAVALRRFALQHIDGVADRRERIAQLMRQRRQKLILAAIGLAQLRRRVAQGHFRAHAHGDVGVADHHRRRRAGGARAIHQEPAFLRRRVTGIFHHERRRGAGEQGRHALERLAGVGVALPRRRPAHGEIIRADRHGGRMAVVLAREALPFLVDGDDRSRGVDHGDFMRQRIENPAKELFARAQRRPRRFRAARLRETHLRLEHAAAPSGDESGEKRDAAGEREKQREPERVGRRGDAQRPFRRDEKIRGDERRQHGGEQRRPRAKGARDDEDREEKSRKGLIVQEIAREGAQLRRDADHEHRRQIAGGIVQTQLPRSLVIALRRPTTARPYFAFGCRGRNSASGSAPNSRASRRNAR